MKRLVQLCTMSAIGLFFLYIGGNTATAQHNVEVSGQILFDDGAQTYGVYGLRVYIEFKDADIPSEKPIMLFPDEDIEGKTYDIVNEDGSFAFDFYYPHDLSRFDSVVVSVAAENAAAIVEGVTGIGDGGSCEPEDPRRECAKKAVPKIGGGYNATPMDTIAFFPVAAGVSRPIDGSSSTISVTNANGELSKRVGLAQRGAMLSREYLLERYGTSTLNYFLHPIHINFELDEPGNNPNNDQGQFDATESPVEISLKEIGLDITTVAHEYGHYVNHRMWNSGAARFTNLTVEERGLLEGWAQFYSFAVRNWANSIYGQPLEEDEDNMEEDPFNLTPYNGNPYITNFPDAPRFASYLWNVYDGPNLGDFHATKYKNKDNDDIAINPLRVFNIMKNIDEEDQTFAGFHNDYKSGLTISQKNSVDDIKDFTDDPTGNAMRPVSTKTLTTQQYSGSIEFNWSNQSYSSSEDYRNDSGAYHKMYLENEDGLNSISTNISYDGTSLTYNHGSSVASGNYQIRTFNSVGESSNYTTVFLGITAPTGLEVTNEGASFGGPRLEWDDHTETIDHYKVYRYRSNPPQGQPNTQHIGTTTSSEFTDINVAINGNSEIFDYHVVAEKGVFYSDRSNIVSVTGDDASPFKRIADEKEALPEEFDMGENYPNPFNPSTKLSYSVPERAEVTLEVFNILGRKVQTLVRGTKQAGSYQVTFDASNLSNGIYIVRFTAQGQSGNTFVQQQSMTLVK